MSLANVATLSIPNPFFEGRNKIYLLRSDPITLVDTGVATDKAFEAIQHELKEHGLRIEDVRRVILTHKHIDHIGNAWRIQQTSGAEVMIHELETRFVESVDPEGHRFARLVRERLSGWGVPTADLPEQKSDWKWVIEPSNTTALVDGQTIEQEDGELEIIHTPGHTMGSICIKSGDRLFSGDHVLPNISPNIGGGDMRNRGMLSHYLDSLRRIAGCVEDGSCVFPGHGEPFNTLHTRCDALLQHHADRLDKVHGILDSSPPQPVFEVARQLFGELESFHIVLGCAEAAAHLEHLEAAGQVISHDGFYQLT